MKRILLSLILLLTFAQPSRAGFFNPTPEEQIERLLESQVRYANRTNFNKFIATYDKSYVNNDGFNIDVYSTLVKELWKTYDNIKYDIKINKINVIGDCATVDVTETSFADISLSQAYDGELKSNAESIYKLKKIDGKWKVVSDSVLDETTTMLYGQAKNLDIKLTVPEKITPNTEYTATLEFTPPEDTIAIASLASDKVEYPQKPAKEVFRALPEDNVLERFFTSNGDNSNEYVVASIGLTKSAVCDLNLKVSLVGFGYTIKRVNVLRNNEGCEDVKD